MTSKISDVDPQDSVIVKSDIDWSIHVGNISWEDGPHMALPEGVQTSPVNTNETARRADFSIRFPEGYIDPVHPHPSSHGVLIIDGTPTIHGHTLTSGDYLNG